jgi:hypothetical protein
MKQVVSVPRADIQRRIEAERTASALKPVRPGPRPKKKRDGHGPAVLESFGLFAFPRLLPDQLFPSQLTPDDLAHSGNEPIRIVQ